MLLTVFVYLLSKNKDRNVCVYETLLFRCAELYVGLFQIIVFFECLGDYTFSEK